jgi:hypothetical protein
MVELDMADSGKFGFPFLPKQSFLPYFLLLRVSKLMVNPMGIPLLTPRRCCFSRAASAFV